MKIKASNTLLCVLIIIEPPHEKTNNVVSELVLHKLSCTSTEDGQRLEILYLEIRGIVHKGAD